MKLAGNPLPLKSVLCSLTMEKPFFPHHILLPLAIALGSLETLPLPHHDGAWHHSDQEGAQLTLHQACQEPVSTEQLNVFSS